MDHAEAAEWPPPRREHRGGEPIAGGEVVILVVEQTAPFQPVEREQPARGRFRPHARYPDLLDVFEHRAIERHVLCFAPIIELFLETRFNFLPDLACVDCTVKMPLNPKRRLQLPRRLEPLGRLTIDRPVEDRDEVVVHVRFIIPRVAGPLVDVLGEYLHRPLRLFPRQVAGEQFKRRHAEVTAFPARRGRIDCRHIGGSGWL